MVHASDGRPNVETKITHSVDRDCRKGVWLRAVGGHIAAVVSVVTGVAIVQPGVSSGAGGGGVSVHSERILVNKSILTS